MPNENAHMIFDSRRQSDPQGVIDDLIAQTRRQGAEIHKRGLQIQKIEIDNVALSEKLEKLYGDFGKVCDCLESVLKSMSVLIDAAVSAKPAGQ